MLSSFKQVQLLVTAQDVENYDQIKSDLDKMRNLVEKSELWVYKKVKSDDSGKKKKKDGDKGSDKKEKKQSEAPSDVSTVSACSMIGVEFSYRHPSFSTDAFLENTALNENQYSTGIYVIQGLRS